MKNLIKNSPEAEKNERDLWIKNRRLIIGNMLSAGFLTNFALRIILNMLALVW